MGDRSLGGKIEGIFKGKGYGLRRASPENNLLVMAKGGEVLSIGYSDLETPTSQGELEMFISISESESATDMLFVSPARIQRDLLETLRTKGIQVWDRTTFVLALGEEELRKASLDEVEEWDAEAEAPVAKMPFAPPTQIDPVAELRRFEKEITAKDGGFMVTKVVPKVHQGEVPMQPSPAKVRYRPFPEIVVEGPAEPARVETPLSRPPPPQVAGPIVTPAPSQVKDTPVAHAPSGERLIAPLKVAKEEASSMAPGSVKDLELVYRPYLLVEMAYLVRTKDGKDEAERKGSFMVDLIDRAVTDLPSSAFSAISPGNAMEAGSQLEELGAIQTEEARRAVAESIRVKDHVIERKVHDGMMSTILKETDSSVVDGSIRAEKEILVHMPVWKGRLSFGGMVWLMDGFAGTQRRTR